MYDQTPEWPELVRDNLDLRNEVVMLTRVRAVALIGILLAPATAAQDLPTDQLDRHAEVVRDDALLRSSLRHSRARQTVRRATPQQVAACANRARFVREHGASHPKVRKLQAFCARSGL